ncbi:MAG: hypothetical protein H7Z43_04855 [Clostridia bacterium]|nr:hypothetical protein [Deltaproteobacteria bacterium]
MAVFHAALTRELEVLIERGMRLGFIAVEELVSTYAALEPSSHMYVADPRRIDLAALVSAFTRLPPNVISAPRVRLVHRLDGFVKAARTHALSDGTILIQARDGVFDVATVVAAMCALLHERAKAHELFRAYGDVPDDPSVLVEHMALALGVDPDALVEATDATGGVLMSWLTSSAALPPMQVHPDLSSAAIASRAAAFAGRIQSALAETGLLGRPVQLWCGPGWLADCLSPYTRELRPALTHWATSMPEVLGSDAAAAARAGVLGEDALYAIAYDLLRERPQLAEERDVADRTAGIYRSDGFELIDLCRVDLGACDPRVGSIAGAYEGAVLVRVTPPRADTAGTFVRQLVTGLQLTRITVVLEGMAFAGDAGALVMPELVVHWAGEEVITLKARAAWDEDILLGFADKVGRGSILSALAPSMLSASHIEALARRFRIGGVEVGQLGVLRGLAELGWSEQLQLPIALALVGTEHVETDRASIASITGVSALAIASLSEAKAPFVPPTYEPAPPTPPTKRPPNPRPGRGLRIKA